MEILIGIADKAHAQELIIPLLRGALGITESNANEIYNWQVSKRLIERLIDSAYLVAETEYVDKVYRDSYYAYYSSKMSSYKRNCVRISIFDGPVAEQDFRDATRVEQLKARYLGYFVLRPIEPRVMGRNIISPKAFNLKIRCAVTTFSTTVWGVKFNITGFPHSSQDSEMITCAETTLWALMEYFSNRYPEYKPTLPSKIVQTLMRMSFERQLPSKGLNITQMSFALKENGFGPRIYAFEQHKDFYRLFSYYVESGIPIVVSLQPDPKSGIASHAVLCIGRTEISESSINTLKPIDFKGTAFSKAITDNNLTLLDFADIKRDYIFVDDNHCVYQPADLSTPAAHYPAPHNTYTIQYFIVPLYTKIYLEAFQAKNFLYKFLISGPFPLLKDTAKLIRVYLASSRTFKDALAVNTTFQSDVKEFIMELSMPKFIWVAELSSKELIAKQQADGIVILDATEATTSYLKPLILAAYQDALLKMDHITNKLIKIDLPLGPYSVFQGNLKSF